MYIEAVVGGEIMKVSQVILEQYTLKKLWEDIKDLFYDSPIRNTEEVKFKVSLP